MSDPLEPEESVPDDRRGVYQGFGNSVHKGGQEPDGASPMPAPATQSSVQQSHVGAPPIRWGWWGAGLIVSAAMWWLIASFFGWV